MNAITIIERFYKKDSDLYNLLVGHSTDVKNKALQIAEKHPELNVDKEFLSEAALLHDIGILHTDAPSINCFGVLPYACHGYIGREMLESLGYPKHGLVCERHTGTGLSEKDIVDHKLPLPHRDMLPQTIEEKIICFSDCFFSKTHPGVEKSVAEVRQEIARYGHDKAKQFDEWCSLFL